VPNRDWVKSQQEYRYKIITPLGRKKGTRDRVSEFWNVECNLMTTGLIIHAAVAHICALLSQFSLPEYL
jgi:hypothetical protein